MGFCLQCRSTEQSEDFNISSHGDECDQCIKKDDPEEYAEWVKECEEEASRKMAAKKVEKDNLTKGQVAAITHAYQDCLAAADAEDGEIDLGSLAEAALASAEELKQEFPFLSAMKECEEGGK